MELLHEHLPAQAVSEIKRGNVAQPVSVTEYTTELLGKE
jgi:hypothetical protein